jgi:hypothetical protein
VIQNDGKRQIQGSFALRAQDDGVGRGAPNDVVS